MKDLWRAISAAAKAMSKDGPDNMTGVWVHPIDGDRADIVATDGHRMHVARYVGSVAFSDPMMIAREDVRRVKKSARAASAIELDGDDRIIIGGVCVRPVQGVTPLPYLDIRPSHSRRIAVSREALRAAVRLARAIEADVIVLALGRDRIVATAAGGGIEYEEILDDAEGGSDDGEVLGVDPRYLSDALTSIRGTIVMEYGLEKDPVLLRTTESWDVWCLVMPRVL